MLYKLKRFLETPVTVVKFGYRIARHIDYKILNQFILNINQYQNLDNILSEGARCLKEILDYELFGFAIENDESLDIWVDPRVYKTSLMEIIKKDFGQNIDYKIHYFDDQILERSHDPVNFHINDVLSYQVMNSKYISRLYIFSKRKMLNYHSDIIKIITRTIGIALENFMNIKRLEDAAAIDSLTNCYNRRALSSYIEHDIANAKRYGNDLSVIMFDLDYFKRINDTYGHQAGDIVLQEISGLVRSTVRKSDYITRYGGEEFLLVLPHTKLSNALELAEKLRKKIETHKINLGDKTIDITASFGVAPLRKGSDKNMLLMEADKMLYKAKAAGRDKVMPSLKEHPANIFDLLMPAISKSIP